MNRAWTTLAAGVLVLGACSSATAPPDPESIEDCDSASPDSCIPSAPPDSDTPEDTPEDAPEDAPEDTPEDAPEDCDSAYPDSCIPSAPPDLDCADVPDEAFTVLPPDPHGFDRDGDGVGCEPYP